MRLSERLLLALSRAPGSPDYQGSAKHCPSVEERSSETSLSLLIDVYPNFLGLLAGKRVLDFGCGEGLQSFALADAGAAEVVATRTSQLLVTLNAR